jgi:hypothetical protein
MTLKTIVVLLVTLLLVSVSSAATNDSDGILGAAWDAPLTGSAPTGYELIYRINGTDLSPLYTAGVRDSSVVLANVGDWATLTVRSYHDYWSEFVQDTIRVYSVSAISDTVVFDQAVTVDPPTGIHWE